VRFWALAVYSLLEEERAPLSREDRRQVTIGEACWALQYPHCRYLLR
jgi:hypothetical protein